MQGINKRGKIYNARQNRSSILHYPMNVIAKQKKVPNEIKIFLKIIWIRLDIAIRISTSSEASSFKLSLHITLATALCQIQTFI